MHEGGGRANLLGLQKNQDLEYNIISENIDIAPLEFPAPVEVVFITTYQRASRKRKGELENELVLE